MQIPQQVFFASHGVAIERQPHQHLARQCAGEHAARPFRKQLAGIERHARRSDRRHPIFDRLLHAAFDSALVNLGAVIIDAVADHRPAVIPALAYDVNLVAAARSVFDLPEIARGGIDRETLLVAMAVTPDFRLGALAPNERVVRGR